MEEHNIRLKQTQTHPKPLISIFFLFLGIFQNLLFVTACTWFFPYCDILPGLRAQPVPSYMACQSWFSPCQGAKY